MALPSLPNVRRVGILEMASPDANRIALWEVFKNRLRDLGHREGENILFDIRWADGRQERLSPAAAALLDAGAEILVTAGTPAAAAASRTTADVPIVMATGVGIGTQLRANEPRRDNVTGISDLPSGVSARRLELLREACGPAAALAFLADRVNPSSPLAVRETQEAANILGLTVETYWVDSPEQIDPALRRIRADGKTGFILAPGAMFFANRSAVARMARDLRLGSISARKEYADAGCLLAYGAPIVENYRQAATYVDRILNGAKPADIPFDEPAVFDLVVNRMTADAIGLSLPASLLSKATTLI